MDGKDAQGVGEFLEEGIDDSFVFFGGISTSGVKDAPLGFAELDGFSQDGDLDASEFGVGEGEHGLEDAGVFSGGAFASARNIGHHAIKGLVLLWEIGTIEEGDGGITDAEAFEDTAHCLDASVVLIVGDQRTASLHLCGELGAFVAGGGAKVDDAVVRLCIEQSACEHGDFFLEVK